MSKLLRLRPVAVAAVAIVVLAAVALAFQQNWILVAVVLIGSAAWAYGTRNDARWFR